jgi:membrane protease YdiL (CAAX protease family)
MNTTKNNDIFKGIIAVLLYFAVAVFGVDYLILKLVGINPDNFGLIPTLIYSLTIQIALLAVIISLFKKTIKENLIDYKNNAKSYLKNYIKYWFLTLALMMISNMLIQIVANNIAENEQAVRNMMQVLPIYTFIASVIIAPLLEELLFRLSIRKIISKNNRLYILVSGISFGFIHVLSSLLIIIANSVKAGSLVLTGWTDLLYIIPYSIPGIIFAYTLVKSKNIFVPISLHMIHNGFLITIQLLTML